MQKERVQFSDHETPIFHKNKLESKMRPSFPEALLVKHIILLDSKMNLMDSVLSEDQEVSRFTSRHNFFGVPILKKNGSK